MKRAPFFSERHTRSLQESAVLCGSYNEQQLSLSATRAVLSPCVRRAISPEGLPTREGEQGSCDTVNRTGGTEMANMKTTSQIQVFR